MAGSERTVVFAIFAIHDPTNHIQAVLRRVFRHYTIAYTQVLHVCGERYTVDQLRGMATFAVDETSGKPRLSSRALRQKLFDDVDMQRCLRGVCEPLESRLHQSLKQHVAQTMLGYVKRYDVQQATPSQGGAPSFPTRLRPRDVELVRKQALQDIAGCFDLWPQRLNTLQADLQRIHQADVVAIPFVGVHPKYGMGLYYEPTKRSFLARLDVIGSHSRHGKVLARQGRFIDIKTGVLYRSGTSKAEGSGDGSTVFGRSKKSILVPLSMGRWHEVSHPFSTAAFLPQRHLDPRNPQPGIPMSGRLVYRRVGQRERYELHVAFSMPPVAGAATRASGTSGRCSETRPIVAINRGLHALFTAVVVTPDGRHVLESAAASGDTLLAVQAALEAKRRTLQRRGVATAKRDRKQSRIATHHVHLAANQIVALAVQYHAQVVMEDLASFASGFAVRSTKAEIQPVARGKALRALLNRRQFEALLDAVEQRLELAGLPQVRLVSSSYISQTCLHCGHRSARNRDQSDLRLFRCQSCGMTANRDVVAAGNVARKHGWVTVRRYEKRADVPENERTTWDAYVSDHPLPLPVPHIV